MKKIKVVFFAEILVPDFDGASRTMFQLLDRINPDRFDFLFVCGTGPDKINQFKCIKIPTLPIPLNPKYKLAIPYFKSHEITSDLDLFEPDVVHIATPSMLGHFALKYASIRQIPVLSIYHTHFVCYIGYYFNYLPFVIRPIENFLKSIQNQFYGSCKKVYVPSASLAAELVASGMSGSNLKIWQRGIDPVLFSSNKKNPEYLRCITGNELPTILFASRLVWEKNLETLIAVYTTIKEQGFQCNWVIVGDGTARNECMRRIPDAFFVGTLGHQELSVLYASASVFVFPSVSETFGNVVLEAMASGLVPVIADGGGSKDLITDGFNGYKCSPLDSEEYAARITAVLKDRTLHEMLSQNAVHSSKAFNWERLAEIYFDDLHELTLPVTQNEAI